MEHSTTTANLSDSNFPGNKHLVGFWKCLVPFDVHRFSTPDWPYSSGEKNAMPNHNSLPAKLKTCSSHSIPSPFPSPLPPLNLRATDTGGKQSTLRLCFLEMTSTKSSLNSKSYWVQSTCLTIYHISIFHHFINYFQLPPPTNYPCLLYLGRSPDLIACPSLTPRDHGP